MEERAKPAIYFGGQETEEFSYVYGGKDDAGEPLCDAALVASAPAKIESESHVNGSVVAALVHSRASGHCFDYRIIPVLKHCL